MIDRRTQFELTPYAANTGRYCPDTGWRSRAPHSLHRCSSTSRRKVAPNQIRPDVACARTLQVALEAPWSGIVLISVSQPHTAPRFRIEFVLNCSRSDVTLRSASRGWCDRIRGWCHRIQVSARAPDLLFPDDQTMAAGLSGIEKEIAEARKDSWGI